MAELLEEAATRPTGREKADSGRSILDQKLSILELQAYIAFLSAIADWGLLKAHILFRLTCSR